MNTKKDFESAILPLLSAERQSFYRQLTDRIYSIKDIMIGLEMEREPAKNFVRTIMPDPRPDEGEKRRFDLADLLTLSVLFKIEDAFGVSRDILSEIYRRLKLAEDEETFVPMAIVRPDDSANIQPTFCDVAQLCCKSIDSIAPAIMKRLIAITTVLLSQEEAFIIVRPPDKQFKTYRCELENVRIFSAMATIMPLQGVMIASATDVVHRTLKNLRLAKYEIPLFPFENRIHERKQVPERKSEQAAMELSRSEEQLIELLRTIKEQTAVKLTLQNGKPMRARFEVSHPARDARPNALLEDERTVSIKSIPGSDRQPSKYIQEFVVEFETDETVAKSAKNSDS